MKKRIFSLLLAVCLTAGLLTGCGSKSADEPETSDGAFTVDLAQFYSDIMDAAEDGPMMMELEGETLDSLYPGLSDVELKQCVVYTPAISAVATEFAFVEVADSADVETVQQIFQARIDTQVDGGAWYPATIESWQNDSEIVTLDNYVCLFVCAEKDGMIEALRTGSEVPAWGGASTDEEEDGVLADGDVAIPVDEETADEAAEASTAPAEASTPAATATPAATTSAATTSAAVTPAATTPAANTPTASAAPSATPAPSASPVATSVDLEAFYETLFPDPDNAPAMMQLDSDLLDVYYPGLTGISTQQCLVYYPMISAVPVEIALIQVTNSSDVKAVKSILQSRIDTAISDQFAYPMITENWELNSRIAVNGNYLFLVACEDCDSFVSAFDSLF
jgi:hypothetical protein